MNNNDQPRPNRTGDAGTSAPQQINVDAAQPLSDEERALLHQAALSPTVRRARARRAT